MKQLRKYVCTCALLSAAALGGCSTLPHDTSPQVLSTYAPKVEESSPVGPVAGREPDLLLRDYFAASAIPTGDYAASRAFMAPDVAQRWSPDGDVLLLDAIDIITASSGGGDNKRVYSVRGQAIGTLQDGGAYAPLSGAYESTFTMEKIDGEWRITELPAGVVIERTELRNRYQPENLYFYDSTRTSLIADRRWVFSGQQSLDTELITMLMQGPDSQIKPAVANMVPEEAIFAGVEDGVYRFTGMSSMEAGERTKFAAQLVWTLSNAGISGPYRATADGAPLAEGLSEMTPDDFADYNPRAFADKVSSLFALSDGRILRVNANDAAPVAGQLGTGNGVQSADITSEGKVAAVLKTGEDSVQLVVGEVDGQVQRSIQAKTLSKPSYEHSGSGVWVVADGERIVRLVRSSTSGNIVEAEVDTTALDGIPGEISVLELSPSGARVALVIGGKMYTAAVVRDDSGLSRIVNVREIAAELGGSALALAWQPDGSMVVGTSTPEAPVWRVEQDGSSLSTLSTTNITAPVVAIAANQKTIFATDANALLQLTPQSADSVFWREVPGVRGTRSAPIVAH